MKRRLIGFTASSDDGEKPRQWRIEIPTAEREFSLGDDQVTLHLAIDVTADAPGTMSFEIPIELSREHLAILALELEQHMSGN